MKPNLKSIALHLLALTALSGCVVIGGDVDAVTNRCSGNSDCAGGVCVDIGGSPTCVTKRADLPGLILEVQPSTEAPYGAGTSFLVPFTGGGLSAQSVTGIFVEHDIVLPHSIVSPIELFVDYDYKGCPLPATGKLPADFIFYRNAPHDGLPDHEGKAVVINGETDAYTIDLPQGIYDMHVIPRAPKGCSAEPPPPTFHRELDVSQGGKLDLHLTAPPHVISGSVGFPKGQDLTGWSIQVVEPKRGKPISATQILTVEQFNLYANYSLEYFWNGTPDTSPVLRLRPPDGVNAPGFFGKSRPSVRSIRMPKKSTPISFSSISMPSDAMWMLSSSICKARRLSRQSLSAASNCPAALRIMQTSPSSSIPIKTADSSRNCPQVNTKSRRIRRSIQPKPSRPTIGKSRRWMIAFAEKGSSFETSPPFRAWLPCQTVGRSFQQPRPCTPHARPRELIYRVISSPTDPLRKLLLLHSAPREISHCSPIRASSIYSSFHPQVRFSRGSSDPNCLSNRMPMAQKCSTSRRSYFRIPPSSEASCAARTTLSSPAAPSARGCQYRPQVSTPWSSSKSAKPSRAPTGASSCRSHRPS